MICKYTPPSLEGRLSADIIGWRRRRREKLIARWHRRRRRCYGERSRERIYGASRRGREAAAAMNHTHAALIAGGWWVVGKLARGGRPTRIKSILYSHAHTRGLRAPHPRGVRPATTATAAAVPRAIRSVAPAFERGCPSELENATAAAVVDERSDAPARVRPRYARRCRVRKREKLYTNTRHGVLTL